MARIADDDGQAAAELVVVVPLLLALLAAVAQLSVAGYALWTAGEAARTGARAAEVGGDPEAAARSALPGWLERRAEIAAEGPVEVTVAAPALLPGVPAIAVSAATDLDPAAGG
jgi:TadE-like protein